MESHKSLKGKHIAILATHGFEQTELLQQRRTLEAQGAVEAGAVRGRTLISWPWVETDIRNAGGKWVDREVSVDNGLITSRKPADIPAFNRKIIEEIAGKGRHETAR